MAIPTDASASSPALFQESSAPNPILVASGATGTGAAVMPQYGQPPPAESASQVAASPYPTYPAQTTPGPITAGPVVTGHVSPSATDAGSPDISGVTQFTAPAPNGWGNPPNNDVATNGTRIGYVYNQNLAYGNGEVANFVNASGIEKFYYTFCAIDGYTGCSDPNIRYDQYNERWVITYEAFPESGGGSVVALAVSNDSSPADGFSVWGLGLETSGAYDAPRVGISSDKVVITVNYGSSTCNEGYSDCTLMFIVNKPELYSLDGFDFHEYQGLGVNYQPVGVTDLEGLALFEAPDFSTANTGTMVTHYVSGAEGSETWTTTSWLIPNEDEDDMFVNQPGTDVQLWADSSEFESAVDASGVAWVSGNNLCPDSSQLCPMFVVFNIGAEGKPQSGNATFQFQADDGVDNFYPALSAGNSTGVLGVFDYMCSACGYYAGSITFHLGTDGSYEPGSTIGGNSTLPGDGSTDPYNGDPAHRWGDINGCGPVPGSSPVEATCIAQYAYDGGSASEVYIVET